MLRLVRDSSNPYSHVLMHFLDFKTKGRKKKVTTGSTENIEQLCVFCRAVELLKKKIIKGFVEQELFDLLLKD